MFIYESYLYMYDISYYYSESPDFVSGSYSFPTLGPKPDGSWQTIPAKDRYGQSLKTYEGGTTFSSVPTTPTSFVLTNTQAGQHPAFSWNSSEGALKYNIYKRNTTLGGNWYKHATVTSTTYTDMSEVIDYDREAHELEYYVKAENGWGESGASNIVDISVEGDLPKRSILTLTEYKLSQNYPNPFNPVTKIRFQMPEGAYVKLVVYDVTGKEVARLVDGNMPAGYHEIDWDASVFASGVYIYKMTAGAFSEVKRMVLIK